MAVCQHKSLRTRAAGRVWLAAWGLLIRHPHGGHGGGAGWKGMHSGGNLEADASVTRVSIGTGIRRES